MATTNKRRSYDGYSIENLPAQIDLINRHPPKGQWRRAELRSTNMVMTTLLQKWEFDNHEIAVVKHLCPWGAKDTYSSMLVKNKCKEKGFQPKVVQDYFANPENPKYDKSKVKLSVANTGPAAPRQYYHVFCRTCETDPELMPALLRKHADTLGPKPNVFSLANNYDSLKISEDHLDFIGCFLPYDPEVLAGPNHRRFLRECAEHVTAAHIWTKEVSVTAAKRKQKQSLLAQSSASSSKKKKAADLTLVPGPSSSQTVLAVRGNSTAVRCRSISSFSTTIPLMGKCRNSDDEFAKGYCISVVHLAANKMLSNATALEQYAHGFQYAMQGQIDYLRSKGHEGLPDAIKVSLNDHNIQNVHQAILDAYRYDVKDSLPNQIRQSPFWSIMHDNIAKFGTEFNGVLLRGVSIESCEPIHAPHALRKMKGGVNAYDVVHEIFDITAGFIAIESSAFVTVNNDLSGDEETTLSPVPPIYFKLGTVKEIKETEIHINMAKTLPVAVTGDGVSVNTKASRLLGELYGMPVPDFRCSSHIASGCIKRMATSKTMNVPEVFALYPVMRTITKHFEASIKNKERLDECMKVLELTPLHLISWCQTRMAHFLTACTVFDANLPALYDAMSTLNIRVEEREQLFTATSIYVLKVVSSLEPLFVQTYLRASDKSSLLVSESFHIANKLAIKLEEESLETKSADSFADSLHFDENGYLLSSMNVNENQHMILLNYQSRARRGVDQATIIEEMKENLIDVKRKIVANVVSNIQDQMGEDTWYYNWSGLDLSTTSTLAHRTELLGPIIKLYTNESIHVVQEYTSDKEDSTIPSQFRDHQIHLYYPAKLECDEKQLKEQFEKAWPQVNSLWFKERNAAKAAKRGPSQNTVWENFHQQHYSEFPDVCEFILIMKSTPANTGPLERSYTKLEIISAKRRNRLDEHNLETQYLLASFKEHIPVKDSLKYTNEIKRLQGKN